MRHLLAKIVNSLSFRGFLRWMPDSMYLKLIFKLKLGYPLNLKDPKTFNEKLQWMKLYNHDPLYTQLVDKYEVRKYVRSKIGDDCLIPLLGVWDKFDDIDFDKLPNQFVLKCTHDSGGLVICKDKSKLNLALAKKKINKCLERNYYRILREWPYKNVTPRIIAEKYMESDASEGLPDYKIFCFNGVPQIWFTVTNRSKGDPRCDYFDFHGNHLPVEQGYKNSSVPVAKPSALETMKEYARILTQGMPHCRADFYEVAGKVYFGELTFFDSSGFEPFFPKEWDYKLGEMIELRENNGK